MLDTTDVIADLGDVQFGGGLIHREARSRFCLGEIALWDEEHWKAVK